MEKKKTFFNVLSRGCNSRSALHMRTGGNRSSTFPKDSFGTPRVSREVKTGISSVSRSRRNIWGNPSTRRAVAKCALASKARPPRSAFVCNKHSPERSGVSCSKRRSYTREWLRDRNITVQWHSHITSKSYRISTQHSTESELQCCSPQTQTDVY